MYLFTLNQRHYDHKPTDAGWIKTHMQQCRMDGSDLIDAIANGQTFVCGAITGTTADTWQSQQIVGVDIDNGTKITGRDPHPLSYANVGDLLKKHKITPMCIYETFSSTAEWPRFRVLVALPEPITDGERMKSLTRRLCSIFRLYDGSTVVDTGTINLDRLFFGTTLDKIKFRNPNGTTAAAIIEQIPDPTPENDKNTNIPTGRDSSPRAASAAGEYDRSDELRMLDCIDSGKCGYNTWIMVGTALKNAGYPLSVWHEWSRKGANYKKGDCSERKWNSLNKPDVTMGYIYTLAQEYGYEYRRPDGTTPSAPKLPPVVGIANLQTDGIVFVTSSAEACAAINGNGDIKGAAAVAIRDLNPDGLRCAIEQDGTTAAGFAILLDLYDDPKKNDARAKAVYALQDYLGAKGHYNTDECGWMFDGGYNRVVDIPNLAEKVNEAVAGMNEDKQTEEQEQRDAEEQAANAEPTPEEREAAQKQGVEQLQNETNVIRASVSQFEKFREKIKNTTVYRPIPTGIDALDKFLKGGLRRQQIVSITGAPGIGKTAFCQTLAAALAEKSVNVFYANMEMAAEQLYARAIAAICKRRGYPDKIDTTDILDYIDQPAIVRNVIDAAMDEYEQKYAPYIDYNPQGVTNKIDGKNNMCDAMERAAETAKKAGRPAPVVFVDYLQIVRSDFIREPAEIYKATLEWLKKFAIEHDTTVFVIVANSRSANEDGRSTLESGRDTSAIEYNADLQLSMVYTEYVNKKREKGVGPQYHEEITVKVEKGRFLQPGNSVQFYFDGSSMTFRPSERFKYGAPTPGISTPWDKR